MTREQWEELANAVLTLEDLIAEIEPPAKPSKVKFDRVAYHREYMREYMRKRRAKQ